MRFEHANRISFFEPNGFAGRLNPFGPRSHPSILVGIQRDLCPPFSFAGARLQRMRVIVVEPHQGADLFDEANDRAGDSPAEDSRTEVLPLLPPSWGRSRSALSRPRAVLGEILRGENGALYERFGSRIRPLQRLVSGPNGEVLEILEPGDMASRLRSPVLDGSVIKDEAESKEEKDARESESSTAKPPTKPDREPAAVDNPGAAPAFRPLFPEPGQWRVVRLADFRPMLMPQLAHPERLRDTHRLPCYVQVFEISAPQRVEVLAVEIFGDASAAPELPPLTQAAVQQLQLAAMLPPTTRLSRRYSRQPGMLLPGDRVFYLEVANDPTDETPAKAPTPASEQPRISRGGPANDAGLPKSAGGDQQSETDQSIRRPVAASEAGTQPGIGLAGQPAQPITGAGTPLAPAAPLGVAPTALKTSIPSHFLKPWEFRMSREEAMYDLHASSSLMGVVAGALRRLFRFRRELRKWQVFLTGKNPEEQLWTVRPPRGGSRHPFIREWAERTLQLAGYETRSMLTEWELFWRRKGS